MDGIIKLILNISILIIIYSIIVSVVEHSKYIRYIKNILMLSVIILVFDFTFNFDIKNITEFNIENYNINKTEIWDNTLENVSSDLEKQMTELCFSNGLSIDEIKVKLLTDYSEIKIESIEIKGNDKVQAKNLIAGYFKIGLAYININGD